VSQRGFWDEQQRVAKLQDKKPVLKRLSDSIPWDSFQPLLERGYTQERKSNAGRKRIDPLILFKMLVLQQLFNLSDEELEFQVNDRRSFEEFVGLGVMNNIPDATTIAFFRERLRKAGVIEELFEMFETYLRSQGPLRPAVARSSMQLLSRFRSNAILARRTRKSKLEGCLKVGMKTKTDCSRRT
jgi:transposase, IS5 family